MCGRGEAPDRAPRRASTASSRGWPAETGWPSPWPRRSAALITAAGLRGGPAGRDPGCPQGPWPASCWPRWRSSSWPPTRRSRRFPRPPAACGPAPGPQSRVQEICEHGAGRQRAASPSIPDGSGSLRAEDVSFRYGARRAVAAARALTSSCAPGERVALLGPSGAGKSTLAELLVRFRDPAAGAVTLDGIDLRELDPGRAAPGRPALRSGRPPVQHDDPREPPDRPPRRRRGASLSEVLRDGRAGRLGRGPARRASTPGSGPRARSSPAASASAWRWRGHCSREARFLILDEPTAHLEDELAARDRAPDPRPRHGSRAGDAPGITHDRLAGRGLRPGHRAGGPRPSRRVRRASRSAPSRRGGPDRPLSGKIRTGRAASPDCARPCGTSLIAASRPIQRRAAMFKNVLVGVEGGPHGRDAIALAAPARARRQADPRQRLQRSDQADRRRHAGDGRGGPRAGRDAARARAGLAGLGRRGLLRGRCDDRRRRAPSCGREARGRPAGRRLLPTGRLQAGSARRRHPRVAQRGTLRGRGGPAGYKRGRRPLRDDRRRLRRLARERSRRSRRQATLAGADPRRRSARLQVVSVSYYEYMGMMAPAGGGIDEMVKTRRRADESAAGRRRHARNTGSPGRSWRPSAARSTC